MTKLQRLKQSRLSGTILTRKELYDEFYPGFNPEIKSDHAPSKKKFTKMLHRAHDFSKSSKFSHNFEKSMIGHTNSLQQEEAVINFNFDSYKFEHSSTFSKMQCKKNDKLIIALLKKDIEGNSNLNIAKNGICSLVVLLLIIGALLYWTYIIPMICLTFGCFLFAFKSIWSDHFLKKFEKDIHRYKTKYKTGYWSKGINSWMNKQAGKKRGDATFNLSKKKKSKRKNFGWGGIEDSRYLEESELSEANGGLNEHERHSKEAYNGLKSIDYMIDYNSKSRKLALVITKVNIKERNRKAGQALNKVSSMLSRVANRDGKPHVSGLQK